MSSARMRLGYNTNGLQNHRLDEAIRLLADHGYEAVAWTPDVCHLDPLRYSGREVDALASLLSELRMEVVVETGARFVLDARVKHEPTLMTRDGSARARRLDYYARCAELGRAVGASALSFWAGVDRSPDPRSVDHLDDGVRRTCELVREQGLEPSLEPEPGMAVATVADFDALCRRLGDEAPALTLDVGHLYATEEGPPVELCRRHAGRCRQVHLEDMRRGVHDHLLPGDGDVAFDAVLTALRDGGYGGPICFELSRHAHVAPYAVQVCRDVWRRWCSGS